MINKNTTKKIHHPQNTENAYSTPRWLSQVSCKLISFGAKALYCRLKTWALNDGICYRSAEDLSQELGISTRQIQRYIKELKDCELIGTFINQYGGVNNFEFYEHKWMFLPIVEGLLRVDEKPKSKKQIRQMCHNSNDKYVVTDTTNASCIKIKEIKKNCGGEILPQVSKRPHPHSDSIIELHLSQPAILSGIDPKTTGDACVNPPHNHAVPPAQPSPNFYEIFESFGIKSPAKRCDKIFLQAISTLEELGCDLRTYLEYLSCKCDKWLHYPYENKKGEIKTNDFFVILKPSIIKNALEGKYEDRN